MSLNDLLSKFESISLEEMEKVKLMNRVDTKFVTHVENIHHLLELASEKYRAQTIDGLKNMPYYSCYYDTPENDMFYQHHRGKKTRQKIRRRTYEGENPLSFLEIKSKNNKGRTNKKRVKIEDKEFMDEHEQFMLKHTTYPLQELTPKIENHFYRITLVNKDMTERVTIDTDIEFHNLSNGIKVKMPEIGIIEWKRDGRAGETELKSLLRDLRIKESGFSKYCIGMAITDDSLKQNRLKSRLRKIKKISEG